MHPEILSKEQKELLVLIKKFSDDYFLVGGTAIALQIGHRMSIDYDLFTHGRIKRKRIKNILDEFSFPMGKIIYEAEEQLHIPVNEVKITFFSYPYALNHPIKFKNVISMPALLDLAAMKAHALGGRAKWRDYVDLFFILKYHHSFHEIANRANELFKEFFNVKLFREQLTFFQDVERDQTIQFMTTAVPDEEIQNFLIDVATQPF